MIQAPTDEHIATLAKAERARRELCRRNLDQYWRIAHRPRIIGAWQIDLCQRLQKFTEAVERKESPCLMVFAPPQHGKSLTVSQAWPAWMMGNHPEWNFILGSYGERLAKKNGRWVRDILGSPRHAALFPKEECRLKEDNQASDEFSTIAGGQLISRGRGGGTTGQPAHIFIVDDPFADRQEAESETIQEDVWDWFWSVAETRLAPGGGKLVMNTRWDERDLAGKLLEHQKTNPDMDQWEIASYPALAEADDMLGRKIGEALHPERYTQEMLERKRRNMPMRDFISMYQQRPRNPDGTYFKVNLINWMDRSFMPKLIKVYQAWDLALSPKAEADESCGAVMGVDHLGRFWLIDMVYGRWSPEECARQIIRFWHKHQAQMVWFENGPPYLGIMPSLKQESRRTGLWVPSDEISHGGKSKDYRAVPLRGMVNGGNLYAPADAPWRQRFEEQMAAFPNGRADDMVDPVAYLAIKSQQMMPNEDRRPLPKQFPAVERSQMVKRTYADLQRRKLPQPDDW